MVFSFCVWLLIMMVSVVIVHASNHWMLGTPLQRCFCLFVILFKKRSKQQRCTVKYTDSVWVRPPVEACEGLDLLIQFFSQLLSSFVSAFLAVTRTACTKIVAMPRTPRIPCLQTQRYPQKSSITIFFIMLDCGCYWKNTRTKWIDKVQNI